MERLGLTMKPQIYINADQSLALCILPTLAHFGTHRLLDVQFHTSTAPKTFEMKSDINKKIFRLLSTEVLLQVGFERSTEHAMNILAEILAFYLESLAKKVVPFSECSPEVANKFLVEDTYFSEQYQIRELHSFLEQQIFIKKQLKDKFDVECDESLLHSLRVLPKGVSLKSAFRNAKAMTLEEKKSMDVHQDVQLDEFMSEFVEKSGLEASRRVAGVYAFNCSKVIEGINEQGVRERKATIEDLGVAPKNRIFGYHDSVLAEQELMIEDFNGTEKYKVVP